MSDEIRERLVRVEEAVKDLPEIRKAVEHVNMRFAKYEGRWGVITMVGMAIWTLFVTFKDEIAKHLK